MGFTDRYKSAFKDRELTVKGLEEYGPVTVKRNAALIVFNLIRDEFDVPDYTPDTMRDLFQTRGVEVLRRMSKAVLVDPAIYDSKEEAEENGGLTFEEFELAHHMAVFDALMLDFRTGGKASAATFPSGEADGSVGTGQPPVGDSSE